MKKLIVLLCPLAIILGAATTAAASPPPPLPRETHLGDGLVFWLTPQYFEARGYPRSGLYRNEELIYSVDVDYGWWATTLYFSDDAMTLLRVGPWYYTVRFYRHGVFVHEYSAFDLLRGGERAMLRPEPDIFGSSPTWLFWELRYYNRRNNLLRVTTVEDTVISFDLTTGLILSIEEPEEPPVQRNNNIVFFAIGAGVCTVALIVILTRRLAR